MTDKLQKIISAPPPPNKKHPSATTSLSLLPYGYPCCYQNFHRGPIPPRQSDVSSVSSDSSQSFSSRVITKAALIGINYFHQRGKLRDCVNDAKNIATYLNLSFGCARENMVILTDDQKSPMSQPTKANIIKAMHWLVKDTQGDDLLIFYYSGHGPRSLGMVGQEDGYDEVIYPVDFRTTGFMVKSEIRRIMVDGLQDGVKVVTIFDYYLPDLALYGQTF